MNAYLRGYMRKESASYVAEGDVQTVGLRKTLHRLLDEKGLDGSAVNNPFTGGVEFTIGARGEEERSILDALEAHVESKGFPRPKFKKMRGSRTRDMALSEEDAKRTLALHFLRYAMSSPSFKKGDRMKATPGHLSDRYRLKLEDGVFKGRLPARAIRQLRGLELPYAVQYSPIRDEAEALGMMTPEDKIKVKELLGMVTG